MSTTRFGTLAAAGVAASVFAGGASASVIGSEDFSYPDGALTSAVGTQWVGHSGTPGTLPVAGGAAVVSQDSGSEDAHLIFGEIDSGVLSATFDVVVTANAISGSDFEYFAHFMTDGTFNFGARLDVVAPSGSGDYTFGIATFSSTAETTLGTDFSFGDVVPVTLEFDFATGLASVSAGGDTAVSTTVDLGASFDSFALRQSNSSSDETITVDNIVITPEPASMALVGLGSLMMVGRRRK